VVIVWSNDSPQGRAIKQPIFAKARGPIQRKPVAAAEQREAAFGCAAVVKPEHVIFLKHRIAKSHDCCTAERRLAQLDGCYEAGAVATWCFSGSESC
jgi:hypothetical protein